MKKRVIAISLAVILLLSVPVFASETRAQPIFVDLSIDGTTANCGLLASAGNMSYDISATIMLYRGTTRLKIWTVSDKGALEFNDTYTVQPGYTYTLTADVTINGTTYPTVSSSATS